jgi:hypothetical protein
MSPVLPKESHHGDQLRRNHRRGRGVNLASTIIWHAVEFSRIGRTPSPARQGRSRGNSSNLADSTVPVKPGTLDSRPCIVTCSEPLAALSSVSRRLATGRPPSPASRSPRAVVKPTVVIPATSTLPSRDTGHHDVAGQRLPTISAPPTVRFPRLTTIQRPWSRSDSRIGVSGSTEGSIRALFT